MAREAELQNSDFFLGNLEWSHVTHVIQCLGATALSTQGQGLLIVLPSQKLGKAIPLGKLQKGN
jgi:hypothetical protein